MKRRGTIDRLPSISLLAAFAAACPVTPGSEASDSEVQELRAQIDAQSERIAELETAITELQRTTASMDVDEGAVRFVGVNVYVQSGSGTTYDDQETGNLILGYDRGDADLKRGSHNFVIGNDNGYRGSGGIIVGTESRIVDGGIVLGGHRAVADVASVVVGGSNNVAINGGVAVGGNGNEARGDWSVTVGGSDNEASGGYALVAGWREQNASDDYEVQP